MRKRLYCIIPSYVSSKYKPSIMLINYTFDIKEENQRQREVKNRFQLTAQASGKYKNQRVKLVLEEPMDRANKWRTYKEYYYTLNISFTNDFDEF